MKLKANKEQAIIHRLQQLLAVLGLGETRVRISLHESVNKKQFMNTKACMCYSGSLSISQSENMHLLIKKTLHFPSRHEATA